MNADTAATSRFVGRRRDVFIIVTTLLVVSAGSWWGGWQVWGREPTWSDVAIEPVVDPSGPCALISASQFTEQTDIDTTIDAEPASIAVNDIVTLTDRKERGTNVGCSYLADQREQLRVFSFRTDDARFDRWAAVVSPIYRPTSVRVDGCDTGWRYVLGTTLSMVSVTAFKHDTMVVLSSEVLSLADMTNLTTAVVADNDDCAE